MGLCELELVLQALDSFNEDPAGFLQVCKGASIKPTVNLFWKDLPCVHIYRSITPDVLHNFIKVLLNTSLVGLSGHVKVQKSMQDVVACHQITTSTTL